MSRTIDIPPRKYVQILPDGQKLMLVQPPDLMSKPEFDGWFAPFPENRSVCEDLRTLHSIAGARFEIRGKERVRFPGFRLDNPLCGNYYLSNRWAACCCKGY